MRPTFIIIILLTFYYSHAQDYHYVTNSKHIDYVKKEKILKEKIDKVIVEDDDYLHIYFFDDKARVIKNEIKDKKADKVTNKTIYKWNSVFNFQLNSSIGITDSKEYHFMHKKEFAYLYKGESKMSVSSETQYSLKGNKFIYAEKYNLIHYSNTTTKRFASRYIYEYNKAGSLKSIVEDLVKTNENNYFNRVMYVDSGNPMDKEIHYEYSPSLNLINEKTYFTNNLKLVNKYSYENNNIKTIESKSVNNYHSNFIVSKNLIKSYNFKNPNNSTSTEYNYSYYVNGSKLKLNDAENETYTNSLTNDEKVFFLMEEGAKHGILQSQTELGYLYYNGIGVRQNYAKAFFWSQKSAEGGSATGQFNLANFYISGVGTEVDFKKANYWFKKSANQDYAEANTELGTSYYYGRGLEIDKEKALFYYTKAAKLEDSKAQLLVGLLYLFGDIVEQDNLTAAYWVNKSVKNNNHEAKKIWKDYNLSKY